MIQIEGLSLTAGEFSLSGIDLRVESNEYFVLLGPTGAGKTLLLKCICGLLRPDEGRIRINGRDVTGLEPRRRRVGYVPQEAGLFGHLNVEQNVMFSLRARGVKRAEARRRVAPIMETLGIQRLARRSPAYLSGGERQRVALARALVGEPDLLLLDEPVSALDEDTRDRVCLELRRVQRELGVTTIQVSHDLEEAMTLADRAGVIMEGRIVQTGSVSELLRRPRTVKLARFLRAENIFAGRAAADGAGGSVIDLAGARLPCAVPCEGEVTFMVRPEAVSVLPADQAPESAIISPLYAVSDRGAYLRLVFARPVRIVAYLPASPAGHEFAEGREYAVVLPPHAIHVLE